MNNLEDAHGYDAGLKILDPNGISGTTAIGRTDGRIVTTFNGDKIKVYDRIEHHPQINTNFNELPMANKQIIPQEDMSVLKNIDDIVRGNQ